jgi:hypothetical protein
MLQLVWGLSIQLIKQLNAYKLNLSELEINFAYKTRYTKDIWIELVLMLLWTKVPFYSKVNKYVANLAFYAKIRPQLEAYKEFKLITKELFKIGKDNYSVFTNHLVSEILRR